MHSTKGAHRKGEAYATQRELSASVQKSNAAATPVNSANSVACPAAA